MDKRTNQEWYEENRHILVTLCPDKHVVVRNESVLECFDTYDDAVKAVRLVGLSESDYAIFHCTERSGGIDSNFKFAQ